MPPQHMFNCWIILLFTHVASHRCPPGDLQLHPPRLVVEYGGSFAVTCNTSQTSGQLGWKTTSKFNESLMSWSNEGESSLPWRVESVQEWDLELKCVLNLTDFQCYENLSLTIYKPPDNVSITRVNYTMGDIQPKLRCDVLNVAPVQKLIIRLYKENVTLNESRFSDSAIGPRNVSALFLIAPTRDDDVVSYRCEAELDLGSKSLPKESSRLFVYRFIASSSNESVMTAVPVPEITPTVPATTGETDTEIDLHQQPHPTAIASSINIVAISPGPMTEGKEYNLSCQIEISKPDAGNITVKWYIGQALLNTKPVNSVMETYSVLYVARIVHNGAWYQCAVEFGLSGLEELKSNALNVQVHDGCAVELIPQRLVVRYGDPAAATCRAQTPITGMGWESTVGTVDLEEDITEVNWTVPELKEWNVKTFCYINPEAEVQCTKELPVLVYKTPGNISVTANRHGPLAEGKPYRHSCHIDNVAPVDHLNVRWFKDGKIVHEYPPQTNVVGPQNVTRDFLIVPRISDHGAKYWCEAELDLGPGGPPKLISEPFFISVYSGCPLVIRPSPLVVRYGDSASANCSTFVPHKGIGWNSTLGAVKSVADVQTVTWSVKELREWTVKPECFIDTDDVQCRQALSVIVYKVPGAINLTGDTGPMTEGQVYTLACHIEDAAPAQNLIVKWFKGKVLVRTDHKYQDTSVGPQTLPFYLKITPDASDHGAQYRCEAELDLGPGGPQLPKLTSNQHGITMNSSWTTIKTITVIIIICVISVVITLFLIWCMRRKQGNYNIIQTHIPLNETGNGKA